MDKVEKPEYHALLSKPDLIKKTRITIKYKNGTVIYQVKGEEQVRIIWAYISSTFGAADELICRERKEV